MKYLVTIRCTLDAEDDLEAKLEANEVIEQASDVLDEDDTIDVTQIIPLSLQRSVEPSEMVAHLRRSRDMLIKTRIIQCFELAKELDKVAWILEHRSEETFDLAGYDYGAIYDLADTILGRQPHERT